MKIFCEVFFLALALILFGVGQTGLGIFAGMFCVIAWMIPNPRKSKTTEELLAEASSEGSDLVLVEYEFIANKGETFTANIHHYSTETISEEKVLLGLSEYITEHTGIPISPDRLHVLSFKEVHN